MPIIEPRSKPLAVSPLKTSSATGAILATFGVAGAVPLMHGAQGCAAFAKVFFIQHFREPIPLQTTAIDAIAAVMGGDDNLEQALVKVAERDLPSLITVVTTGLTEMQGCDLPRSLTLARERHPVLAELPLVAVNTPDFSGSFESGYAAMVLALLKALVRPRVRPQRRLNQINVLASAAFTPADVAALRSLILSFGLQPIILPELADSLDGHLGDRHFNPCSPGGTTPLAISEMGASVATLVCGASLANAGRWLEEEFAVPCHPFDHLGGMAANDRLIALLAEISGQAVPAAVDRARRRYQDALLDAHFYLGGVEVALAGEGDELLQWSAILADVGAVMPLALAPTNQPQLARLPVARVLTSDLNCLEQQISDSQVALLIGNAHVDGAAGRLDLPLLRRGFPVYDRLGAADCISFGYEGGRALLFAAANALLANHRPLVTPFRSRYAPFADQPAYGGGQ